jgi:hypothetical protein
MDGMLLFNLHNLGTPSYSKAVVMLAIIFTIMLVLPFPMKIKLSLAQKVIISPNNIASSNFLNSGEGAFIVAQN